MLYFEMAIAICNLFSEMKIFMAPDNLQENYSGMKECLLCLRCNPYKPMFYIFIIFEKLFSIILVRFVFVMMFFSVL